MKRKLKKLLGNQPFDIDQHCKVCEKEVTMVANLGTNKAVCKVCRANHDIDDSALDPVVKALKDMGIY